MAPFVSKIPVAVKKNGPAKPPRDSKIAESTRPAKSSSSIHVQAAGAEVEDAPLPTPSPEPTEPTEQPEQPEPEKPEQPTVEKLSEEHIHALFSGAPNFFAQKTDKRAVPRVSYPWDAELHIKDVSDSMHFAEPAFSAATLHRHLPLLQQSSDQDKPYQGYDLGVVEAPSMLSAQGLEPVSTYPSPSVLQARLTACLPLGNHWVCALSRAVTFRPPRHGPPTITDQQ